MGFPPPLDTLSAEEQAVLATKLKPVSFAAGECIFRAGDPGDGCYLIEQGDVRLELERERHVDTETVLGFIGPGSFLGELSLLDGQPRSLSAYAETPLAASYLAAAAVAALCDQHPRIGNNVVRALG